jgi:hypothetical protein
MSELLSSLNKKIDVLDEEIRLFTKMIDEVKIQEKFDKDDKKILIECYKECIREREEIIKQTYTKIKNGIYIDDHNYCSGCRHCKKRVSFDLCDEV